MCVSVSVCMHTCVSLCAMPMESPRGCQIPRTRVKGGYKLPDWYGCWGLNAGPLKGDYVLLTSEPSIQPQLALVPASKDISRHFSLLQAGRGRPILLSMEPTLNPHVAALYHCV